MLDIDLYLLGGSLYIAPKKGFSPPLGGVVFPHRNAPDTATLNSWGEVNPSPQSWASWSEMVLSFLSLRVWAAGGLGHRLVQLGE